MGTLAIPKTRLAFFIVFVACFSCAAGSAEDTVKELKSPAVLPKQDKGSRFSAGSALTPGFRIGLIGADPRQLLHDFDPLVRHLKSSLRNSGIRSVTVFVAKDLDQMRSRIQKGELDFIFTTAFPVMEMEPHEVVPAVVAVQDSAREDSAVFFVQKRSFLQNLSDLRGKTIVFGTPWSTAAYAMAIAELKKNNLSVSESTARNAPEDAIRYTFAGEAINQAVQVIRSEADAGVVSDREWEKISPKAQERLRIVHRTAPITRLLGSFRTAFPQALREATEKALVDMSGNRKGRTALAALHITSFERITEEDTKSLERLKQQLSGAD